MRATTKHRYLWIISKKDMGTDQMKPESPWSGIKSPFLRSIRLASSLTLYRVIREQLCELAAKWRLRWEARVSMVLVTLLIVVHIRFILTSVLQRRKCARGLKWAMVIIICTYSSLVNPSTHSRFLPTPILAKINVDRGKYYLLIKNFIAMKNNLLYFCSLVSPEHKTVRMEDQYICCKEWKRHFTNITLVTCTQTHHTSSHTVGMFVKTPRWQARPHFS